MKVKLDILAVRKLIDKLCPTDADFEALCINFFPQVKRRFSDGMNRLAKENLLLEIKEAEEIVPCLQRQHPEEFERVMLRLIDDGAIEVISLPSLWPAMSKEALEMMTNLKDEYIKASFPSYQAWTFSFTDETSETKCSRNELRALDLIEPFSVRNWRLSWYAVSIILDEVPISSAAVNELEQLAELYEEKEFPNHEAWAFQFTDDERSVRNELQSRGFIEAFSNRLYRLSDHGKDAVMKLITDKRNQLKA